MDRVLRGIFGVAELKDRCDDDYVDRLSRKYSVTLLVVCLVIVTTKTYVGNPIHCWCPAQFTDTHKSYATTICWLKNTYYVPLDNQLPLPHQARAHLSYYQWVPFILALQALLCYTPSILWRVLSKRSGLNLPALIEAASTGQRTPYADIRGKTIQYIVYQMDRYVAHQALPPPVGKIARVKHACVRMTCSLVGGVYGNFLCLSYAICKLLYLANAVGQLYLLDCFMGDGFHGYGLEALTRLLHGQDWTHSERFPRVTMCDFRVRHMNVLHPYVVQCVLPINLFNEKIFLFIWFWLFLLAFITIVGFLKWFFIFHTSSLQVAFIRRRLKPHGTFKPQHDVTRRFVLKYLGRDGGLVIRLISDNVGDLVASEVVEGLWQQFGSHRHHLLPTSAAGNSDVDTDTGFVRIPDTYTHRMRRTDSV